MTTLWMYKRDRLYHRYWFRKTFTMCYFTLYLSNMLVFMWVLWLSYSSVAILITKDIMKHVIKIGPCHVDIKLWIWHTWHHPRSIWKRKSISRDQIIDTYNTTFILTNTMTDPLVFTQYRPKYLSSNNNGNSPSKCIHFSLYLNTWCSQRIPRVWTYLFPR